MRFVIHMHSGNGPTHWDLMLQDAEALATWQLAQAPALQPGQAMPAKRLADHRTAYLTYEGPVSGDRGEVKRFDEGEYITLARAADRWEVTFEGNMLAGRYELAGRGDEWTLKRLA